MLSATERGSSCSQYRNTVQPPEVSRSVVSWSRSMFRPLGEARDESAIPAGVLTGNNDLCMGDDDLVLTVRELPTQLPTYPTGVK